MAKKNFKDIGAQAASKFFPEKSVPINEHDTHDAHKESNETNVQTEKDKNKYINKQRMNIAFDDGLLDYLHIMIRLDGVSATKYINKLIIQDKKLRENEYHDALKLFNQK